MEPPTIIFYEFLLKSLNFTCFSTMSGFAKAVNVVICGGGNGSHVLAGLTSMVTKANVTVVDIFEDEAERWTNSLSKFGFCVDFGNGKHIRQEPGSVNYSVTKDGSSFIPKANIVIICVPAYTHELYLNTIASLLPDNCLVVGMPGQPGFEYQCAFILKKFGKNKLYLGVVYIPKLMVFIALHAQKSPYLESNVYFHKQVSHTLLIQAPGGFMGSK